MPRRSHPVVYDDVIDDMEPEVYPSRRYEPILVDREPRYSHSHRMPRRPVPPSPPSPPIPPAPIDPLPDRRHARDRARSEIMPGSYEYVGEDVRDEMLAAERLARLDLNAYRNEAVSKYDNLRKAASKADSRPKPRGRRPEKISDVEEAYFSTEESKDGLTDSESEMEEVISKSKRPVSSKHSHGLRTETLPRSKSVRDSGRKPRSKYDDGGFTKSNHSLEEYTDRVGPRHGGRRPHHRSHYHLRIEDDIDDSGDSEESEIDVVPKRGRRGTSRREYVKPKHAARKRGSSSSSSESAGSSEEELPKVPLPVPVPPTFKEPRRHRPISHVSTSHTMPRPPSPPVPPTPPSPPHAPSLEAVLAEREARHRKQMKKAVKEEAEIERRSRESLALPQEPPVRRKKGKQLAIVEAPVDPRKELLVEDERIDPRMGYSRREREVIEEDIHRTCEAQPTRSSPEMDDWAIVQAPPKPKRSPEKVLPVVDVREESSHSRHRDRGPRSSGDDLSRELKGDRPRGKVGSRYIGVKDRRERWTEITKDLVVREAIERAGYEFEEMDSVYYIFAPLYPEDVDALVDHSDEIRRLRRRRIAEIQRERASMPPPSRRSPIKSAPMLPERPPSPPMPPSPPYLPREERREDRRRRERERERERDLVREEDIEASRYRARSGRW
ncbi:hypothetical protein BDV19DRAFT_234277 [Aspergillus venezuelensis]